MSRPIRRRLTAPGRLVLPVIPKRPTCANAILAGLGAMAFMGLSRTRCGLLRTRSGRHSGGQLSRAKHAVVVGCERSLNVIIAIGADHGPVLTKPPAWSTGHGRERPTLPSCGRCRARVADSRYGGGSDQVRGSSPSRLNVPGRLGADASEEQVGDPVSPAGSNPGVLQSLPEVGPEGHARERLHVDPIPQSTAGDIGVDLHL